MQVNTLEFVKEVFSAMGTLVFWKSVLVALVAGSISYFVIVKVLRLLLRGDLAEIARIIAGKGKRDNYRGTKPNTNKDQSKRLRGR